MFVTIGAAAVVVLAIVGYISYNALSGLPLESRYHVTVALPDARKLIATSDVRIANLRVGQVASVETATTADGRHYAQVELKLEPDAGPLPTDTTVSARAASPLGQTYLDLELGESQTTIPDGGGLPLAQGRPSVDVQDLFQIFDRQGGENFQKAFRSIGEGVAHRGRALNATIGSLSALLPDLERVSRALASREARLSDFIDALVATTNAVVPVRQQLSNAFGNAATTFVALNEDPRLLGAAIEAAPAAELAATRAFTAARPGLARLARAARSLQPAVRRLKPSVTAVDRALGSGETALRSLRPLERPTTTVLDTLRRVAARPSTRGGLRKLRELFVPAQDLVDTLLPAQQYCNVFGIFLQNTGSLFGTVGSGNGPTYVTFGQATSGQPGEQLQSKAPSPSVHINNSPLETAERCDSNNEPYIEGRQLLKRPERIASNSTRETNPPPGVIDRARAANLLAPAPATR